MGRTVRKRRLLKNKHEHMYLPIKGRTTPTTRQEEEKEDGLPQEEGREEDVPEKDVPEKDVPEEDGQGEGGQTVRRRLLKLT